MNHAETPRSEAGPDSTAARGRLSLLGPFDFSWDGVALPLPLSAQRLLAFLTLQGRPLRRSYVAGSLWPEMTDLQAGANLRTAVWRLRRTCSGALEVDGQSLDLGRDVQVDVTELVAWARRIVDHEPMCLDEHCLDPAYSGDLLDDWYDDWLATDREYLRQRRLHATELLCERLTAAGRSIQAVQAGLVAVALEPLRESAHRALIRAHLAEGNLSEALRQHRLFRDLLWSTFEVEPSAQMEALIEGLTSRHRGAEAGVRS